MTVIDRGAPELDPAARSVVARVDDTSDLVLDCAVWIKT